MVRVPLVILIHGKLGQFASTAVFLTVQVGR